MQTDNNLSVLRNSTNIPITPFSNKRKFEDTGLNEHPNKKARTNETTEPTYETFFSLAKPYNAIETLALNLNQRTVNLYPTEKVQMLFKEYQNSKEFVPKIVSSFDENYLSIETDTTVYFPKKFTSCKEITIKHNNLIRNNSKLMENITYIFVLSQNNQLFATQKQCQAKHGRIHHSSLVQGEAVRTAGMLAIQSQPNHRKALRITNESGHYRPSPASLDKIIEWFGSQGLKFEIEFDIQKMKNSMFVRTVELNFHPTK